MPMQQGWRRVARCRTERQKHEPPSIVSPGRRSCAHAARWCGVASPTGRQLRRAARRSRQLVARSVHREAYGVFSSTMRRIDGPAPLGIGANRTRKRPRSRPDCRRPRYSWSRPTARCAGFAGPSSRWPATSTSSLRPPRRAAAAHRSSTRPTRTISRATRAPRPRRRHVLPLAGDAPRRFRADARARRPRPPRSAALAAPNATIVTTTISASCKVNDPGPHANRTVAGCGPTQPLMVATTAPGDKPSTVVTTSHRRPTSGGRTIDGLPAAG